MRDENLLLQDNGCVVERCSGIEGRQGEKASDEQIVTEVNFNTSLMWTKDACLSFYEHFFSFFPMMK